MEPTVVESLGIEDPGKWLPFCFDMGILDAIKMTTDDVDNNLFNCTSLFTKSGDTYIIDTPYKKMHKIFKQYHEEVSNENDLTL